MIIFHYVLKTPPIAILAARLSSSLRPRRSVLSLLKPRNHITTMTSQLSSRRLSNTMDPKALMEDMESGLFHYTSGRYL